MPVRDSVVCRMNECVVAVYSGIDGGNDLPKELLEYLYTSTVAHEIKMRHDSAPSEKGEAHMSAALCRHTFAHTCRSYYRNAVFFKGSGVDTSPSQSCA